MRARKLTIFFDGGDPLAFAVFGEAAAGGVAGWLVALGAFDWELVEAEWAVDDEMEFAVGVGAEDVEVGGDRDVFCTGG